MKQKISILSFFLIILLTITSVMAIPMPYPVYGKITQEGQAVSNLEVRVENFNTKASGTTFTDSNGFYQVDLGNIDERWVDGQTIKVFLVYCSQFDNCVSQKVISGGGAQISFDIAKTETLPSTSTVITPTIINPPVVEPEPVVVPQPVPVPTSEPPTPPVIITRTVYECSNGVATTDLANCPKELFTPNQALISAVTIVIVGLGLMWSWAINNGVKSKYRWIPGMKGILQKKLDRYKELCKLGKEEEALKLQESLLKYSKTLTENHLEKMLK